MPLLLLKSLPRYECLLKAAEMFPSLDPGAFELFLHLLRAGDDVYAPLEEFFMKHRISQGRFTVLMLLKRSCNESDEKITPAMLAEESRVSRATMTGLIDTLEKDGYVTREADEQDRRTLHVRLTQEGRDYIYSLLPEYFECATKVVHPLSEDERKQLVALLQKIKGPHLDGENVVESEPEITNH